MRRLALSVVIAVFSVPMVSFAVDTPSTDSPSSAYAWQGTGAIDWNPRAQDAPRIEDLAVKDIESTRSTITWAVLAKNPVEGKIFIGTDDTVPDVVWTKVGLGHNEATLIGLEPATVYYFQIRVHDTVTGLTADSPIAEFSTLAAVPGAGTQRVQGLRAAISFQLNGRHIEADASSTEINQAGTLFYRWNFGDATESTGVTTSHDYSGPGTYKLRLTVSNPSGQQDSAVKYIQIVGASDASEQQATLFGTAPGGSNDGHWWSVGSDNTKLVLVASLVGILSWAAYRFRYLFLFPGLLRRVHNGSGPGLVEALTNPTRRRIFKLIQVRPGIQPYHVWQDVGGAFGVTLRALYVLERTGLVRSVKSGRNRHYFENSARFQSQNLGVLSLLSSRTIGDTYRLLIRKKVATQREIAAELGISIPTASLRLSRMKQAGLITVSRANGNLLFEPVSLAIPMIPWVMQPPRISMVSAQVSPDVAPALGVSMAGGHLPVELPSKPEL